ncbi:MAG: hypothetical protein Q7K03_04220 [Dehalococcoidia bacterium]|nr:hypothetical protein [Dehalococcoidia bacterium]
MKTIISYERSTGAGARHGTMVFIGNGRSDAWAFVSEFHDATKTGRKDGFDIWEMPAWEGAKVREYHCSNSGTFRIAEGRMLDGPRTEPQSGGRR